jgi:hypothetical protein
MGGRLVPLDGQGNETGMGNTTMAASGARRWQAAPPKWAPGSKLWRFDPDHDEVWLEFSAWHRKPYLSDASAANSRRS